MAAGGRREAIDGKIKGWERDLEQLRLALARAPEAERETYHAAFVALYRQKEVVRSRWEELRGVYLPEAGAVQQFEEALAALETAWGAAQPMLARVLETQAG